MLVFFFVFFSKNTVSNETFTFTENLFYKQTFMTKLCPCMLYDCYTTTQCFRSAGVYDLLIFSSCLEHVHRVYAVIFVYLQTWGDSFLFSIFDAKIQQHFFQPAHFHCWCPLLAWRRAREQLQCFCWDGKLLSSDLR